MKIKEIIVVEGKKDTANLKRWLDVDTLETSGTGLTEATLDQVRQWAKTRGVIIFTDPDTPGDQIRQRINSAVPGCKNAFLPSGKAWEIVRGKRKVGVEHAGKQEILAALEHCLTYESAGENTLSWSEVVELGLTGLPDSAQRRKEVGNRWHVGEANAKTLWKRLNLLKVTKAMLEEGRDADE